MGYPTVSNPSEKLSITSLKTVKVGSGFQVSCMINGQSWLKEIYAGTKATAVDYAMESINCYAKYYPSYKENV